MPAWGCESPQGNSAAGNEAVKGIFQAARCLPASSDAADGKGWGWAGTSWCTQQLRVRPLLPASPTPALGAKGKAWGRWGPP